MKYATFVPISEPQIQTGVGVLQIISELEELLATLTMKVKETTNAELTGTAAIYRKQQSLRKDF